MKKILRLIFTAIALTSLAYTPIKSNPLDSLMPQSIEQTEEKIDDDDKNEIIKETIEYVKKHNIKLIDLDFIDIFGELKSYTVTPSQLKHALKHGASFSGSSVTGYAHITRNNLLLKLNPETIKTLPWTKKENKTAVIVCDVCTMDGRMHEHNPRRILKKILGDAHNRGLDFRISAKLEFFIFNNDTHGKNIQKNHTDHARYCEPIKNEKVRKLLAKIINTLNKIGITPERTNPAAGYSQHEITLKHTDALTMADQLILAKRIIQTIGHHEGFHISFMPKPLQDQAGNSMHINYSLYDKKTGENLFYDEKNHNKISEKAQSFMAGNLEYIRELSALFNPTINSYKRLIQEAEQTIEEGSSPYDCSTCIRIPAISDNNCHGRRLELRSSDATCNPYLAFAALLKSGIEGIKGRKSLVKNDDNFFEDNEDEVLPQSLAQALDLMESSDFIQKLLGDSLYLTYLYLKRAEVIEFEQVVTQWELDRYL